MPRAICQPWTETERGWGQRPDGYSLHQTEADLKAYSDKHWADMKKIYGEKTPDEYSFPDGKPYTVEVDAETFAKLQATKNGMGMSGSCPSAVPLGT